MKTVEQVAREAADAIIEVRSRGGSYYDLAVSGHEAGRFYHNGLFGAPDVGELIRRDVAKAIAEAIEDAMRLCPVPAGLSDEGLEARRSRVEAIRPLRTKGRVWRPDERYSVWRESILISSDLLAHIDHLHRIMADPMDRLALDEAYRRGLADGARPLTLLDPDEALAKTPPGED